MELFISDDLDMVCQLAALDFTSFMTFVLIDWGNIAGVLFLRGFSSLI